MGNAESLPEVVDLPYGMGPEDPAADAQTDAEMAAAARAALGISAPTLELDKSEGGKDKKVMGVSISDYKLEPTLLGEGGFGKVRLATNATTNHQVAVKIIKRNKLKDRAEELLTREVKHHELLRHENIVSGRPPALTATAAPRWSAPRPTLPALPLWAGTAFHVD